MGSTYDLVLGKERNNSQEKEGAQRKEPLKMRVVMFKQSSKSRDNIEQINTEGK